MEALFKLRHELSRVVSVREEVCHELIPPGRGHPAPPTSGRRRSPSQNDRSHTGMQRISGEVPADGRQARRIAGFRHRNHKGWRGRRANALRPRRLIGWRLTWLSCISGSRASHGPPAARRRTSSHARTPEPGRCDSGASFLSANSASPAHLQANGKRNESTDAQRHHRTDGRIVACLWELGQSAGHTRRRRSAIGVIFKAFRLDAERVTASI